MSASSKKKLRNAQAAEKMTERQLQEQKEAKKLKIYTIVFVAVLVVMIVAAVWTAVSQTITGSGILERNTTAMTVGDREISAAELNYFYVDAVNEFYSQYGSYASMFGLDVTKPLNEQIISAEEGTTWADNFMETAKYNIQTTYALANAAEAAGYELAETDLAGIQNTMSSMELYAAMYQYPDADSYLKAMYGNGASVEGYRAYYELRILASSYEQHYAASLSYDDAALRAAEAENFAEYSSFTFNSYYLPASKFLEGGTTAEDGTTTYSDEETANSVKACEEAANALLEMEIDSVIAFDEAIAGISVNTEDAAAKSTPYTNYAYANINSYTQSWIADEARQEGEIGVLASTTESTDADGNTTTKINGYYIVYYIGSTDNIFPLRNARHILIEFQGGTTDETGTTVYSDEEKADAKAKAQALLDEWLAGEATEDSFATLANQNTQDPGSVSTGGLYENIYPGQMVETFNDWVYDESRKSGDTDLIETSYGYHVMYYVGESEITYRDYMISNTLRNEDLTAWSEALIEATVVTVVNTKYTPLDLVLSRS